ncbi:hypothetical protein ABT255_40150 [Streptomyces mirabilis]|uniref:hypothetical protein n=1 Tax=Streptomyces mirabilis TaxID=68239 RepID=UPI00332CFE8A
MTPSDNRPDPIDDMLAALREDDPDYTDAELDAGFTAVLTDLEQLTSERAREADDLAAKAELGNDAYALGLEYRERGDLQRAAHWLRIATSHGVPAAHQQLQDARELHHTVDSMDSGARPPLFDDQSDYPGWYTVLDRSGQALTPIESRLKDLQAAELLAAARQEADRIVADARRAAAQIEADAQPSTQPHITAPNSDVRPFRVWHPIWQTIRGADLSEEGRNPTHLIAALNSGFAVAVWDRCPAESERGFSGGPLWSPAEGTVVGLLQTCHVAVASGQRQSVRWLTGSRHGLHNLIGREATEAYEQALEENDPSHLTTLMAADPMLMPRLLEWTQTASPAATVSARRVLASTMSPSTGGLVLPPGARDGLTPVPAVS